MTQNALLFALKNKILQIHKGVRKMLKDVLEIELSELEVKAVSQAEVEEVLGKGCGAFINCKGCNIKD